MKMGGYGDEDDDSEEYDDYGSDGDDDLYGMEEVANAKKAFGNEFDFGAGADMAALPGVDGFIDEDDDGMAGQMPSDNTKNEENILLNDMTPHEPV